MSSSLRRGTLAATTLAISALTLTACGAGNNPQTHQIRPDNASMTVGDIKIQNINVVTTPDGGPATVSARIFNEGTKDEKLQALVAAPGSRAKLSPAKDERELTIPAGGSLMLGGKDNAAALFADADDIKIKNGSARGLSFVFSETGEVPVRATVVPATEHYEKFGPTEAPSTPAPDAADEKGGKGEQGERGEGEAQDGNGRGEQAEKDRDGEKAGDGQNADRGEGGEDAAGQTPGESGEQGEGEAGSGR
ncbi:DUF461 domain-containing protein [Streptomyces sp. AJS327]|uniref:DUF461 domain-containing protein n=1 Tax=Streptomyces sp. AJS327 TaxID=2545265 RepID=UPI0015DE17C0|nr:DUF461 domain-containing protein [Streptomyces sp. AJS327]MBA0053115.1 DUF461 domain-containing protein [Streptomyces sp. AJS327]